MLVAVSPGAFHIAQARPLPTRPAGLPCRRAARVPAEGRRFGRTQNQLPAADAALAGQPAVGGPLRYGIRDGPWAVASRAGVAARRALGRDRGRQAGPAWVQPPGPTPKGAGRRVQGRTTMPPSPPAAETGRAEGRGGARRGAFWVGAVQSVPGRWAGRLMARDISKVGSEYFAYSKQSIILCIFCIFLKYTVSSSEMDIMHILHIA